MAQKTRKTPTTEINLLYGMDNDAFQRMAEEHGQRTTWIAPWMSKLANSLTWTTYSRRGVGEPPKIGLTILGWLLVLGLVACLSPRHFVCRALLWLPLVGYLFTTLGVGDALARYLHPVEWVAIVIIGIGLDTVTTFVARGSLAYVESLNRLLPEAELSPDTSDRVGMRGLRIVHVG